MLLLMSCSSFGVLSYEQQLTVFKELSKLRQTVINMFLVNMFSASKGKYLKLLYLNVFN